MRTALGFRAHSGWAAMVAVGGTIRIPRVLLRQRIVVADLEVPGSKQPYHAASELPLPQAEELVLRAVESSRGLAMEAISLALKSLRAQGHEVGACGVPCGSGRTLPPLQKILAAHPLIHTAEGEMFRDVLVWGARRCGLRVACVREKELDSVALRQIESLGKLIGPPWTQDQKFAALAALMALD